jgi:hypothetical protein
MMMNDLGPSKHFHMLLAYHQFVKAIGYNVDIEVLWAKLEEYYDLDALVRHFICNSILFKQI